MNIFMRLWKWICNLFSTKTIEPKIKITRLQIQEYEATENSYTLTSKDWELVEEQQYFQKLKEGMRCSLIRNKDLFKDSTLKKFKEDPEFKLKWLKITKDPKTIANRRQHNPQVLALNIKIINAIVAFKEERYSNIRQAYEAYDVIPETVVQKRSKKERDALFAKAQSIFKQKLKAQKEKEDALKEEILLKAKSLPQPKISLQLTKLSPSKTKPKTNKLKPNKRIIPKQISISETLEKKPSRTGPAKKKEPQSFIRGKLHAGKVLLVFNQVLEDMKSGLAIGEAIRKHGANRDQFTDLKNNWFPELDLNAKWKEAKNKGEKPLRTESKYNKKPGKVTRKSGTLGDRVNAFNQVCEMVSKGIPITTAFIKCNVAPEVVYDIRDSDDIFYDAWEIAKEARANTLQSKPSTKKKSNNLMIPGVINDDLDENLIVPQKISFSDELKSIMKNPLAVKEITTRIDDALLEHAMGESLETALKQNKVDEAKFHQYHRMEIGNITTSMKYAQSEYKKLQSLK